MSSLKKMLILFPYQWNIVIIWSRMGSRNISSWHKNGKYVCNGNTYQRNSSLQRIINIRTPWIWLNILVVLIFNTIKNSPGGYVPNWRNTWIFHLISNRNFGQEQKSVDCVYPSILTRKIMLISIKSTLRIDKVILEIKNTMVEFEEYEVDVNELVWYEQITGNLVFDIKLGENFYRKSKYCADGNKIRFSTSFNYSTIILWCFVSISLLKA